MAIAVLHEEVLPVFEVVVLVADVGVEDEPVVGPRESLAEADGEARYFAVLAYAAFAGDGGAT